MSRGGPAWRKLGIAPTSEQREIRRAYAAKLKQIDVEKDSQAFIALREAFEQAQREAEWMRHDAENDEEEYAFAEADAVAPPLDEVAEPGPAIAAIPTSPWAPPSPEQIDAHASALADLLYRNDEEPRPWPSDADKADMLEHWRIIRSDPRLQRIDFHGDVEGWIARLVGYTIPFSDTLIVPVTEYFGWMRDEGTINQHSGMAEITERYRMLWFIEDVQRPDHRHNAAWVELTTPAGDRSKRGKIPRQKITDLLQTVRAHVPGVERSFDPERVALWEPPAKTGPRWVWLITILIFGALAVWSSAQHPNGLSTTTGLREQRADIQMALDNIGDGTLQLAEVERRNPGLSQLLKSNWEISRTERMNAIDYIKRMLALLGERARDQLSVARDDLLAEHLAIVKAQAEALRSGSAETCMAFLTGTAPPDQPVAPELKKRGAALTSRILLETTAEPLPGREAGQFKISPNVFKQAAARAKLSVDDMRKAALNKARPAQNCAARIALIETVLEMPAGAERTRLLRAL